MTSTIDLTSEIIRELTAIQGKPPNALVQEGDFPIPSMLPSGADGGIWVTKSIEKNIATLAAHLKTADATLERRFTDAEWVRAVRQAIGPCLARIDLDNDLAANASTVLTETRAVLSAGTIGGQECEYALPCTLFGNFEIEPFSIGSVLFEPREKWLERKAADEAIPQAIADRVARRWRGESFERVSDNLSHLREESIINAFGRCSFVCSINTSGYASEAGKDRALTAARLALTMIALLWPTPSKTLEGFNLLHDRSVRIQSVLSFIPGKVSLPGSKLSQMPHGPTLKRGEWENEVATRAPYFGVCGEVLDFMLSPTGAVARPNLMNTLAQSLIWFHEACRESVGLMAVVNFAAAMDALACGHKSNGILALINARLGIAVSAPVYANGPTLRAAIETIYSEGRSRAIHGVSQKIGHDWTSTRNLAEQLARLSLSASLIWAASNSTSDDPHLLRR
jgi:hypothetical protein